MIPAFSFDNLISWILQAIIIASLGALLPLVLRIRHPKSQLAYYHAILLLCFALPWIQPWQDTLAVMTAHPASVATPVNVFSSGDVVAGILVLGAVAKLCWLGLGFWQLRRYRRFAIPLTPSPEPIREARRLTGTDALFCLSRHVSGPATLGYIDPVVLLPMYFESLDVEEQRSIACHELLHVRRKDWAVTIVEEVVCALLWFNPGVWWVLAQAKLSREQLVDAEVVKLTAREPYLKALLSMAVVSRSQWALPAASFFTQGHLIGRMRLLLKESKRSLFGLCISYATVGILLALTAGISFIWLPLLGEAHTVALSPQPRPLMYIRLLGTKTLLPAGVESATNFTIPVPAGRGRFNVQYFGPTGVVGGPAPGFENGFLALPPPPLPPPPPNGPLGFLGTRGVRMIRPGEVASAKEVERLRKALGERAEVEVIQGEDGTVQRVSVRARRPE
jgi:beta-lactamase regulating signal transducer with metallopeptidase domain